MRTVTKLRRMYEEKQETKLVGTSLLGLKKETTSVFSRRAILLPAAPLNHSSVCKVCRVPMWVADGTLARYHKECRQFRHGGLMPINHKQKMKERYT